MSKVMLVLGGCAFMLQTAPYRPMARTSGYRWQGVDRLGRKPAQQYLGPGADEITLEGEIMPAFGGGASQLDTLRALAATGKPQLLVTGRGDVLGDWIIAGIEENGSEFMSDGTACVLGFSITLSEYGADRGGVSALITAISAISAVARLL